MSPSDSHTPEPGRSHADGRAISTFTSALRYLNDHIDLERARVIRSPDEAFKLDRTRLVLEALGNPQDDLRLVHVAGTKGKGSTVAMLSACLANCGLAIGEFTSPHLIDVRERIRVNGRDISAAKFTALMREIQRIEATLEARKPGIGAFHLGRGPLHYFEILTAAALLHFADEAVDLAILEVGLGGRLDSTNVILPEVCIITQISLDHTDILGSTPAEIAREKAGILKPGVVAVSAPQEPEVEEVLRAAAGEVGADLRCLGQEIEFAVQVESSPEHETRWRLSQKMGDLSFDDVIVPLKGAHQTVNCAAALAAIGLLRERGYDLDPDSIIAGLGRTTLPGRMEMVCDDPRIVIDGAHNTTSLMALVRTLNMCLHYETLVVIFGCGQDKDVDGMLRAIAMGADKIIFTRTRHNPRAMSPEDLAQRFADGCRKTAQTASDLESALQLARRAVTREDLICITGSFYLAGEARALLVSRDSRSTPPADGERGRVVVKPRRPKLPKP